MKFKRFYPSLKKNLFGSTRKHGFQAITRVKVLSLSSFGSKRKQGIAFQGFLGFVFLILCLFASRSNSATIHEGEISHFLKARNQRKVIPRTPWKEQFENEFKNSAKDTVFNTLKKGIFFHQWDRDLPFWGQLENPDLVPNIKSFLNFYHPIIMDEIRVSLFHKNLNTIRSLEFLESYLKFSDTDRLPSNQSNINPQHPLISFIINGNLNGIADFMQNQGLSHVEKLLIFIAGVHSHQFDDQILELLNLLQLDINQTVKVKDFKGLMFSSYLHPSVIVTSLGYELIASASPKLIRLLLDETSFDPSIKNALLENPLHFFIRTGKYQNTKSNDYFNSINLLLNHFFNLIKEKDLLGFNPLMIAAQTQNEIFIDGVFSRNLIDYPPEVPTNVSIWTERVSKENLVLKNFWKQISFPNVWIERDRYGRSLIDLSFENNHIDFAYEIRKKINLLPITLEESLYEKRVRQKKTLFPNWLPYIRISPVLLYYIEGYENLIKLPDTVVLDQETAQILNELKKDVIDKVDLWEIKRQKILVNLLKEPVFFAIYSAIQEHRREAMENLSAKAKKALTLTFIPKQETSPSSLSKKEVVSLPEDIVLKQETSSTDKIFILHFLNEAIILNSLPAVEYLLENNFTRKWFQLLIETNVSGYKTMIDPLSLALFAYLSVPEDEKKRKESARQIVRLVATVQNPGLRPNTAIHSSPMEWAIALGLLDKVKFFHEEKGIDIPESIIMGLNQRSVEWTLPALTKVNAFLNLKNYIDKKSNNKHPCFQFIN